MSPNFLSVFMGLLILFPYLFNFFIFFQYQKYYTIYDAFLYYVGLLLSSIIGLVIKKLLSFSVSKTGHMAHLRLDLIVNALKKIVINIFIMTSLFCLLQILQAGLWLHKIMHLNDNSLNTHAVRLQHRKPLSI